MFACNPANIDDINGSDSITFIQPKINVYHEGELITPDNPLRFGSVIVGDIKELDITITNEGTATLYSPKIEILQPQGVFKVEPIQVRSLPVGTKHPLKMYFSPNDCMPYKAEVVITGYYYDNITDPPRRVDYKTYFIVRGEGICTPIINVYHREELITVDNPYDFGMVVVNQTKKVTLTLKNEGNATLYSPKLVALTSEKPEFKLPVIGIKSISPGNSIDIVIYYTPNDEGADFIIPFVVGHYYPNSNGIADPENYSTKFKCMGYGVYVY
jgi:hypothetical protein